MLNQIRLGPHTKGATEDLKRAFILVEGGVKSHQPHIGIGDSFTLVVCEHGSAPTAGVMCLARIVPVDDGDPAGDFVVMSSSVVVSQRHEQTHSDRGRRVELSGAIDVVLVYNLEFLVIGVRERLDDSKWRSALRGTLDALTVAMLLQGLGQRQPDRHNPGSKVRVVKVNLAQLWEKQSLGVNEIGYVETKDDSCQFNGETPVRVVVVHAWVADTLHGGEVDLNRGFAANNAVLTEDCLFELEDIPVQMDLGMLEHLRHAGGPLPQKRHWASLHKVIGEAIDVRELVSTHDVQFVDNHVNDLVGKATHNPQVLHWLSLGLYSHGDGSDFDVNDAGIQGTRVICENF